MDSERGMYMTSDMEGEITLSHPPMHSHADAKWYLSFRLANRDYAVTLRHVLAIKPWASLPASPSQPGPFKDIFGQLERVFAVSGWGPVVGSRGDTGPEIKVVRFHNRVIPIIDIHFQLDLESKGRNPRSVLIALCANTEHGESTVGIVPDSMGRIFAASQHDIHEPSHEHGPAWRKIGAGTVRLGPSTVFLLDTHRLVNLHQPPATTPANCRSLGKGKGKVIDISQHQAFRGNPCNGLPR